MNAPSRPLHYLLGEKAWELGDRLVDQAEMFRVAWYRDAAGARIIDCGVAASGGLEAGRRLAEICLAGLGEVSFAPGQPGLGPGPAVVVRTDQPVLACLASQYAGWRIMQKDEFFAMGSGPMRAAWGKEPLFDDIGGRERPARTVGVLEAAKIPSSGLCRHLAEDCGLNSENLTLLVARTASLAGTVQIVARSVETAMHKLHELKFDVRRVRSGYGVAPLPPPAADDLTGIGRTNDAILYGADVVLWIDGDDEELSSVGVKLPSSASRDFGTPFLEIFRRYEFDFYRIDPMLFSPARVQLINVNTGRQFSFGQLRPDVLQAAWK
jgi:methenyltetrahydromethanopterin cyclohydrolase